MSKAKCENKGAPGLEEIGNLFPPSASSSLVANNVLMKLPAFWPDAAEVWFTQGDTQFAMRSITVSKTKFYHAVVVVPREVASQILDLISAPPAGDPYEVLRVQLFTLYTLNNYQRFEALVKKPLLLMNWMLALIPDYLLTRLHPQQTVT